MVDGGMKVQDLGIHQDCGGMVISTTNGVICRKCEKVMWFDPPPSFSPESVLGTSSAATQEKRAGCGSGKRSAAVVHHYMDNPGGEPCAGTDKCQCAGHLKARMKVDTEKRETDSPCSNRYDEVLR